MAENRRFSLGVVTYFTLFAEVKLHPIYNGLKLGYFLVLVAQLLCVGASEQWIPGDVGAALAEAIRWPAIGGKLEEAKVKKEETSPTRHLRG